VEGPETVISTVEPSPNYLIGPSGTATVTIADDPAVVTVAASDPDASETGPDPGVFTISRSGGNLAAVLSVVVARSGTATNGADYVGIGGPNFIVAIPANQAGATVTIMPIDDAIVEGLETVILAIRPSPNYVIGVPDSSTVTIADND
jgi:glycerophosphoryl diester phosphodiesterase